MTVLTLGTFDILHRGHIRLLRACNAFSENGSVTVGLNSDRFINKYRGIPPVQSFKERAELIESLRYVDHVRENDGPGRKLIKQVKPDFLVVGSDWAKKDYYKQIDMTQKELDDLNIQLVYVPYTEGISSSMLKK